jgi:hypothetical protein|tara:strand:+ start:17719 stop:18447 length:729 start_codon:yes stop_codon:yes gene_type:complete
MSQFGTRINNDDGREVISSSSNDAIANFTPIAIGTAVPGNTGSTFGPVAVNPATEILAFNRTTPGFIRGAHSTNGYEWTVENNSSSTYGNIHWIKLRRGDLVAATSGTAYGLNVYVQGSTDLVFSSTWETSCDVLSVTAPNTVGSIQTNNTNYTTLSGAMPGETIYTAGDMTSVYIAPGKMLFNTTVDSNGAITGGRRIETFKIESGGVIRCEGLYSHTVGGTRYRVREKNQSAILILKRRL